MLKKLNWSWITGFYEGEGGIHPPTKYKTVTSSLRLSIAQSNKEILDKIAFFIGFGTVRRKRWGGRYARIHRKPHYELVFYGDKAEAVAVKLRSYMHHPRKIRQLDRALKIRKRKS